MKGIRAARAGYGAAAADSGAAAATGTGSADLDAAGDTAGDATAAGAAQRGVVAAFVRFVVCGGGVSLLSSAALLAVAGRAPFALANAVVTVVSTLLATELHHRFTFAARGEGGLRAAGLAGWRIHAKSALTLVVAYLFTTAAVLALGALHPHAGPLSTQAVYLGASAVAGTGRFLVLRLVVFARRPALPVAPPLDRGKVAVAA